MPDHNGKRRRKDRGLSRDQYAMCGLTNHELKKITKLLFLDTEEFNKKPDQKWLADQEARIVKLHGPLHRSVSILDRIVARIDDCRKRPPAAQLCSSHRNLNPKVIRKLMLIVTAEFTERTERFRVWRRRTDYSVSVAAWLDRIDATTGLWIGHEAFTSVFGYERGANADVLIKGGCEACILSIVGGRPQLLVDLRASLVARQDKHGRRKDGRRGREPRLLRLVDAWLLWFTADSRRVIEEASDVLAEEILLLMDSIEVLKEKREKEKNAKGKEKKVESREKEDSKNGDKRSKVRDESKAKKVDRNEKAESDSSSIKGRSHRKKHDEKDDKKARPLSMIPESAGASSNGDQEEQAACDDDTDGLRTANWLQSRVQQQGLTAEERAILFSDLHPALSDYGSRNGDGGNAVSVVPSVDSQGQHIPFRKRYPDTFKPSAAQRSDERAGEEVGEGSRQETESEELDGQSGSNSESDDENNWEVDWEPWPVETSTVFTRLPPSGTRTNCPPTETPKGTIVQERGGKIHHHPATTVVSVQTSLRARQRVRGTAWEGMYGDEEEKE